MASALKFRKETFDKQVQQVAKFLKLKDQNLLKYLSAQPKENDQQTNRI